MDDTRFAVTERRSRIIGVLIGVFVFVVTAMAALAPLADAARPAPPAADPATAVSATWARTYGGGGHDGAHSIVSTPDGGNIVIGDTQSFGAGGIDAWVLRLDADGAVVWEKAIGGPGNDRAWSVALTSGGTYVVVGETSSFGAGGADAWLLEIDDAGAVVWQRTYGGAGEDAAFVVQATSDGGFVVGAQTASFGAGELDYWILKLDGAGSVQWERTYGTSARDSLSSVAQAPDGTYLVSGLVSANGGKAWVLKLDAGGNVLWDRLIDTKRYQWLGWRTGQPAITTADGGALVFGGYNGKWRPQTNLLVLKLDASGATQWSRTFGSLEAVSAVATSDGGYALAGSLVTSGNGGGAGYYDVMVLKLDRNGNAQWKRAYGGRAGELGWEIRQTYDGGYVVAAGTGSFGAGGGDAWVLKLASDGSISPSCPGGIGASVPPQQKSLRLTAAARSFSAGVSSAVVAGSSANAADTSAAQFVQC